MRAILCKRSTWSIQVCWFGILMITRGHNSESFLLFLPFKYVRINAAKGCFVHNVQHEEVGVITRHYRKVADAFSLTLRGEQAMMTTKTTTTSQTCKFNNENQQFTRRCFIFVHWREMDCLTVMCKTHFQCFLNLSPMKTRLELAFTAELNSHLAILKQRGAAVLYPRPLRGDN